MNQLVLASPIGRWPVYQLETGEPFDMSAWYNWVGGVGAACWLVAYVITIVRGFKEKTFGIPLVAICLNFTWELMDSFFLPDPILLWKVIDYAWLLMDFVIVYQLWRFGEREQSQPELRKYFHPMVLLLMGCAFLGQYSWVTTFHDTLGLVLAFVINLVMSALFIGFFFERRATGRGLSLPVAWLKMLGTALSSVQCYFLIPLVHPVSESVTVLPTYAFFWFLFGSCFVLDCAYIALVTRAKSTIPERL